MKLSKLDTRYLHRVIKPILFKGKDYPLFNSMSHNISFGLVMYCISFKLLNLCSIAQR